MSSAAVTTDRPRAGDAWLDDGTAAFCAVRSRLLGIAHRILGDRGEAEDVVQDAWLRWQLYDRSLVANATAFLVTTTTRLAINATQSARARREVCAGQWLPEAVAPADDPAVSAEHHDEVATGLLVLLERLAPTERAAFVLHEAFDYPYPRIAALLRTTEANARQLTSRARRRVAIDRSRAVSSGEHRQLLDAFAAAAWQGDVDRLEQLLAARVTGVAGLTESPAVTSARPVPSSRRRHLHASGRAGPTTAP
jgi:RNA polymerase sigma-70 factor (ECF subfamily)